MDALYGASGRGFSDTDMGAPQGSGDRRRVSGRVSCEDTARLVERGVVLGEGQGPSLEDLPDLIARIALYYILIGVLVYYTISLTVHTVFEVLEREGFDTGRRLG